MGLKTNVFLISLEIYNSHLICNFPSPNSHRQTRSTSNERAKSAHSTCTRMIRNCLIHTRNNVITKFTAFILDDMVIRTSFHNCSSGNFTNVPTNFVRNISLHQTDYSKLYQNNTTIQMSWIPKFELNASERTSSQHHLEHWLCGTFGAFRPQLTQIKRFITKQFQLS
jgi:hypothetical protein